MISLVRDSGAWIGLIGVVANPRRLLLTMSPKTPPTAEVRSLASPATAPNSDLRKNETPLRTWLALTRSFPFGRGCGASTSMVNSVAPSARFLRGDFSVLAIIAELRKTRKKTSGSRSGAASPKKLSLQAISNPPWASVVAMPSMSWNFVSRSQASTRSPDSGRRVERSTTRPTRRNIFSAMVVTPDQVQAHLIVSLDRVDCQEEASRCFRVSEAILHRRPASSAPPARMIGPRHSINSPAPVTARCSRSRRRPF